MNRRPSINRSWWFLWLVVCFVTPICRAASTPEESQHERFPIVVHVDFGSVGHAAREEHLAVDAGSTPKDAVSLLFPIESGAICCNTREVAAIDGVRADPAKNRWWTCRVNGSAKLSPFRTELKSGDRIEWTYLEQQQ